MRYGWNETLTFFGVNIEQGGGADFAELCLRLINGARWRGTMPAISDELRAMAKARGVTTQPLSREMKAAVRPVLEQKPEVLRLWGIHLEKQTSTALAVALAERELRLIRDNGEAGPNKTITHKGVSRGTR